MNKFHCLIFATTSMNTTSRSYGAHRIATYLRENNWDAEVIDYFQDWSLEELIELARSRITKNTKFLGFSFLFIDEDTFRRDFVCWVKENYPNLKIIVGAQFAWPFSHDLIDYVVYGYGEKAIIVLLKYLFSNGKMPILSKFHGNCRFIDANTHYPSFPLESLKVIYEDRDFILQNEKLGIEFSRGCMFSCAFCNYPILGVKGDYSRSQQDFQFQLTNAYNRFGIKNYYVIDETFNDRTEKITKFADVVGKLNFLPNFGGYIRADLLINRAQDKEELIRMNFTDHFYGIESFNYESAKCVGKGMKSEKLKSGLIAMKEYFLNHGSKKYNSTIGLIIGLPHETFETINQSIEWLEKNWIDQSLSVEPLSIPISEWEKPSKLSLNYKEYGYEELEDDGSEYFKTLAFKKVKELMWINKNMNILDANKISSKLQKNFKGNNLFKLNDQIKEIIEQNDVNQKKLDELALKDFVEPQRTFIDWYIVKKLSYHPSLKINYS